MKLKALGLICLLISLAPVAAIAQSNIKAAFDAIINCSDAEVTATHSLEKDPETNIKSGQDDIYNFVMPASKMNLIKKALAAFDKDIPKAFAVKSGKNKGKSSKILLHTEQSGLKGISIDKPGFNYIYALFLPSKSEDPDGKYRYAYALAYKEEKGEIHGKIVINYATTLKYRESAGAGNTFQWKDGSTTEISGNGVIIRRPSSPDAGQQTWFEKVMACLNGIERGNSNKTNLALATKAYTLIGEMKDHPEVTDQDMQTLHQILKTMRSDKHYTDSVLTELLRQCELAIK